MTSDEKPDWVPTQKDIAMSARATIELFGNGAIAKTNERLSEIEAEGGEKGATFRRPLWEK